ncbi:hypothetical protein [Agromyces terreus]|uniref:hypothetical protein n=1 Tax=Agromyces terreus TaxID=424795 RepID=UPI0031DF7407
MSLRRGSTRARPSAASPNSSGSRRGPGRLAVGLGTVGVLALCSLGAAAGVHAAGGDEAAPASIIAKILGTYETDDGEIGTDASGVQPIPDGGSGDGRDDGSGRDPDPDAPATDAPATPEPTPGDDADPDDGDPDDATPEPDGTPSPDPDQGSPAPVDPSDPMSPEYNPYTTQGDPAYVTDAEKSAWLGREAVVRTCMADAGFEYLDWQWWLGGSPQPAGQSPDDAAAWSTALRGDGSTSGCRGAG